MRHDAFDNVACPFNYKAELKQARKALDLKVGTYISENPTAGYRELARMFGISLATLCSIAMQYSRRRKPGRRSSGIDVTFDVRHIVNGKEFKTRVTVTREEQTVSVSFIRSLLETYFRTTDVVKAGKLKADRYARYTARELHQFVSGPAALKERQPLP